MFLGVVCFFVLAFKTVFFSWRHRESLFAGNPDEEFWLFGILRSLHSGSLSTHRIVFFYICNVASVNLSFLFLIKISKFAVVSSSLLVLLFGSKSIRHVLQNQWTPVYLEKMSSLPISIPTKVACH